MRAGSAAGVEAAESRKHHHHHHHLQPSRPVSPRTRAAVSSAGHRIRDRTHCPSARRLAPRRRPCPLHVSKVVLDWLQVFHSRTIPRMVHRSGITVPWHQEHACQSWNILRLSRCGAALFSDSGSGMVHEVGIGSRKAQMRSLFAVARQSRHRVCTCG